MIKMSWEGILKKPNYCLQSVARDLYKADLENFGGNYYGIHRQTPYNKQIASGEMDESDLREIIDEAISAYYKHEDKGRIDATRRKEVVDAYEEIRRSIDNCKDVKSWDEGK